MAAPQPVSIRLPQPHEVQMRVIRESRRFNILACGRRWGKSTLATDRIIHAALNSHPTAWFAPNFRLLLDVWRELQTRLKPIIRDSSEKEKRLALKSGGTIEMWSLDSGDAARGRAYALILVDECALAADLERAWTATLRPMLSGFRLVFIDASGCRKLLPPVVCLRLRSAQNGMALLAVAHLDESAARS